MTETFVLIKPDGVARKLVGKIITKMERKGLSIIKIRLLHMSPVEATGLYRKYVDTYVIKGIVTFMTSGPSIAMIVESEYANAVDVMRKMIGATGPASPAPSTIRGEFAESFQRNVIHASDSAQDVTDEIRLFFPEYRP